MRRSAKIAILVLALVGMSAFVVSSKPDDGLDWIRKYGGKEGPVEDPGLLVADSSDFFVRASEVKFTFRGIPPELVAHLKRYGKNQWYTAQRQGYTLPGPQIVRVMEDTNQVSVVQPRGPSWLRERWEALMRKMGFQ